MNAVTSELIICTNPTAQATVLDGELIIMGATDSSYYRLNQSGVHIWNFIAQAPCSLGAVIAYLADYYQLDEAKIGNEVQAFIALMLAKGIFIVAVA